MLPLCNIKSLGKIFFKAHQIGSYGIFFTEMNLNMKFWQNGKKLDIPHRFCFQASIVSITM